MNLAVEKTKKQMIFVFHTIFTFPSFSVAKLSNNNRSYFYFLVDGENFAFANDYDKKDPEVFGAASITLYLGAWQVVQIANAESTEIIGTDMNGLRSWFSGYLVYAV